MEIVTTKTINAETKAVWGVLGEDFGNIADWAKGVSRSVLDGPMRAGAQRTCDLVNGPSPQITEKVTSYAPERRSLSYQISSGLPGMFKKVENHWSVKDLGQGRSEVKSTLNVDLAWYAKVMSPVVKSQFSKTMVGLQNELEQALKTG